MRYQDIVGKRIGIYDILYECDFKSDDRHKMFHVKCSECGWETDMIPQHINKAKLCNHVGIDGKYKNFSVKWEDKNLQHIFLGMKMRCYSPKNKSYRWYGGKGIKVCDEWMDNPKLFEIWSISNGYKKGLTIDRIDENKDYSPDNCRWITNEENSKYKSTTKIIEVDGIKRTGREWAKFTNLGINTINKMLREYPEKQVQEFIKRRLQDLNKTRHSHQTWMNVYGLE